MSLVTIECARPGERYALLECGGTLDVHLAEPCEHGGVGHCLCGFDRHAAKVGFSVGGGFQGFEFKHEVCAECVRLAGDAPVEGLHKELVASFVAALASEEEEGNPS